MLLRRDAELEECSLRESVAVDDATPQRCNRPVSPHPKYLKSIFAPDRAKRTLGADAQDFCPGILDFRKRGYADAGAQGAKRGGEGWIKGASWAHEFLVNRVEWSSRLKEQTWEWGTSLDYRKKERTGVVVEGAYGEHS